MPRPAFAKTIAALLLAVALPRSGATAETGSNTGGSAAPLVTITQALSMVGGKKRVRIHATLMMETAPGFFFAIDETGRMRGNLIEPIDMKAGDLIEIDAEPITYHGVPWLGKASAKVIGHGALPTPLAMRAGEVYADEDARAQFDAAHVTMTGIITGYSVYSDIYTVHGLTRTVEFQTLEVDDAGTRVLVIFHPSVTNAHDFLIGTQARFTGVCRLQTRLSEHTPRPIHVLLPDVSRVSVLHLPPLWERPAVQRAMRVTLLVLGGIAALGLAWALGERRKVNALRASEEKYRTLSRDLERRVEERTAELAAALTHQTELARLKTDFVSLVSHEFRTPLGVIMSATDVLRRYFDRLPPDKRERHLEMIHGSTRNLATLIEEVLLLGRVEEGRLQFTPAAVDLERLCRLLTDELLSATAGECVIHFQAGNDLSGARTDETILRHILSNLLSNAVKYSERGRLVELTARREDADAVFVVRDHGIGIPAEDQSRLFNSFTRGSNVGERPGSGLGLVIVHRCVLLHGGTLDLQSTPGLGTTVTVRLPMYDHATAASSHIA